MMVHDDDVRLRRVASRLEQEALLEVRALHARAQSRLGRHLVPHLGARRRREVGERSVLRALGPRRDRRELVGHAVVEQLRRAARRLLEPRLAEVVAPSLQQREAHRLIAQRLREERQILADELLLQVDRVRRHDRALAIRRRPAQRGHEIAERLADAGARLEQPDAALVVDARDRRGHLALARAVLVARDARARSRPSGPRSCADARRVERLRDSVPRHLDDDVELASRGCR